MKQIGTVRISLSDIKEILHSNFERSEKIEHLNNQLDQIIENGLWEESEVLPSINDSYPDTESCVRDCIIYYVCRLIVRIKKDFKRKIL